MAEEICPSCGCTIVESDYEKEGVMYCCEPCAIGGQCDCGCCTELEIEPEKES